MKNEKQLTYGTKSQKLLFFLLYNLLFWILGIEPITLGGNVRILGLNTHFPGDIPILNLFSPF